MNSAGAMDSIRLIIMNKAGLPQSRKKNTNDKDYWLIQKLSYREDAKFAEKGLEMFG